MSISPTTTHEVGIFHDVKGYTLNRRIFKFNIIVSNIISLRIVKMYCSQIGSKSNGKFNCLIIMIKSN